MFTRARYCCVLFSKFLDSPGLMVESRARSFGAGSGGVLTGGFPPTYCRVSGADAVASTNDGIPSPHSPAGFSLPSGQVWPTDISPGVQEGYDTRVSNHRSVSSINDAFASQPGVSEHLPSPPFGEGIDVICLSECSELDCELGNALARIRSVASMCCKTLTDCELLRNIDMPGREHFIKCEGFVREEKSPAESERTAGVFAMCLFDLPICYYF